MSNTFDMFDILFVAIVVVVLAALVAVSEFTERKNKKYLTGLAKKYNLSCKRGVNISLIRSLNSRHFKYEKAIWVRKIMEGDYKGHTFSIFNYKTLSCEYTAGSCEFGKTQFPHILLQSKGQKAPNIGITNDPVVTLEEEYLQNFILYCARGYETEALQIFTKELLTSLQQISDIFSIEFGGNRFFAHLRKDILREGSEDTFLKLVEVIHTIIDETDGLLFRLQDDFEALDPYFKKYG